MTFEKKLINTCRAAVEEMWNGMEPNILPSLFGSSRISIFTGDRRPSTRRPPPRLFPRPIPAAPRRHRLLGAAHPLHMSAFQHSEHLMNSPPAQKSFPFCTTPLFRMEILRFLKYFHFQICKWTCKQNYSYFCFGLPWWPWKNPVVICFCKLKIFFTNRRNKEQIQRWRFIPQMRPQGSRPARILRPPSRSSWRAGRPR